TQAQKLAAEGMPGLVLADIQLADGSSGLDAVADLLAITDVPVIFITAFPERLLTGNGPEPTWLITKPFRLSGFFRLTGAHPEHRGRAQGQHDLATHTLRGKDQFDPLTQFVGQDALDQFGAKPALTLVRHRRAAAFPPAYLHPLVALKRPLDVHPAAINRQRAIFAGIGGQFMHRQPKRKRVIGRQFDIRPVKQHGPFVTARIGR
ncbi:hypothetical protein E4T56_gene5859, partial [Termitomyces sp. T112]